MSDTDKLSALMLAEIPGGVGREEISPLIARISLTPKGICSRLEVNKKVVKDFEAEEWLKETDERLAPIMREQTEKFSELVNKKFDVETKDVTDADAAGKTDPFSDMMVQALKDFLDARIGGQP